MNHNFRQIKCFGRLKFREIVFWRIDFFEESLMTNDESWYYTIYGDIWYKSGYSCFLKCEFVNSPNSRRSPFGVRFHRESSFKLKWGYH